MTVYGLTRVKPLNEPVLLNGVPFTAAQENEWRWTTRTRRWCVWKSLDKCWKVAASNVTAAFRHLLAGKPRHGWGCPGPVLDRFNCIRAGMCRNERRRKQELPWGAVFVCEQGRKGADSSRDWLLKALLLLHDSYSMVQRYAADIKHEHIHTCNWGRMGCKLQPFGAVFDYIEWDVPGISIW